MASIQLSIADPCHENWNNMLPEEKGRFCLSCQKTVVDFTNMSDGQVFDYFKNYNGNTCGQFTPQQLDRDIAKPKTHSIGRWKYFWQILLPAVFAFYKVEGQTLKGKVAPKTVCRADSARPVSIVMGMIARPSNYREPKYELQGTVLNEKQEPIPFASIVSENSKNSVAADSNGHFSVQLTQGENLIFSSVGYESKTFTYDSLKPASIKHLEVSRSTNTILIETNIQLKQATVNLAEVRVVGYGALSDLIGMAGGISVVRRVSLFSAPKIIKPTTDLPALKIFPNPIQPGQSFQVNLRIKKTGNYLLRIIDAAGKTMLEEKLNISSKNQTETISGRTLQQAGIYFLQISNPADKKEKELTGKVVVQ